MLNKLFILRIYTNWDYTLCNMKRICIKYKFVYNFLKNSENTWNFVSWIYYVLYTHKKKDIIVLKYIHNLGIVIIRFEQTCDEPVLKRQKKRLNNMIKILYTVNLL